MKKIIFTLPFFVLLIGFFLTKESPSQAKITSIATISSNAYAKEFPQYSPPAMKLNDPLPQNLFVELGRIINPAIVNISTSATPKNPYLGRRDPMLEMLEQFYGFPISPRQQAPQEPQQMSLGTGFIIREDGLIITNNHVIANADLIHVQLQENSKEKMIAKLIGHDQRTDIALIKIESKEKLPVAALGSSKELQVGEWVAAFGNPYGHGHTMTKGIISSKGREIGEINKFPLLQTDASINPGNSGGPLVNTKGYVIGVNSAIDARAQGIGFAIPIDDVKSLIPQLEKNGTIKKGYLGAGLGDLDPQAAKSVGLDGGAFIVNLDRKGPASKAGLKPYDIVTEFNGKVIKSSLDLVDAVSDATIGKKANLKVLRDSKSISLQVEISERPDEKQITKKSLIKTKENEKAPFDIGFEI
nr:trypsin-like peptidase domain-containing protein [Pseudobdellovibrionaceae bacterium]